VRKILKPLSQTKPFIKRFGSSEDRKSLGKVEIDALRNLQNNPQHVLAKHIIERSRQSVLWTDDRSLAVATVVDENSILEHRSFATFANAELLSQFRWSSEDLALVNNRTKSKDLIVSLKGARVPFVVRVLDRELNYRTMNWIALLSTSREQPLECKLIGECLIDRYECFDMAVGRATPEYSRLRPRVTLELQ
jgi:hypothetical protein